MEKLRGLKCRECGRGYPSAPVHVCEFCFGPLEVDYHYEALKGVVTRQSIAAGPPSMWRYKDLLPIEGDVAVGHHVGFTATDTTRSLNDHVGWQTESFLIHTSRTCSPPARPASRTIPSAIPRGRSRIASYRWR